MDPEHHRDRDEERRRIKLKRVKSIKDLAKDHKKAVEQEPDVTLQEQSMEIANQLVTDAQALRNKFTAKFELPFNATFRHSMTSNSASTEEINNLQETANQGIAQYKKLSNEAKKRREGQATLGNKIEKGAATSTTAPSTTYSHAAAPASLHRSVSDSQAAQMPPTNASQPANLPLPHAAPPPASSHRSVQHPVNVSHSANLSRPHSRAPQASSNFSQISTPPLASHAALQNLSPAISHSRVPHYPPINHPQSTIPSRVPHAVAPPFDQYQSAAPFGAPQAAPMNQSYIATSARMPHLPLQHQYQATHSGASYGSSSNAPQQTSWERNMQQALPTVPSTVTTFNTDQGYATITDPNALKPPPRSRKDRANTNTRLIQDVSPELHALQHQATSLSPVQPLPPPPRHRSDRAGMRARPTDNSAAASSWGTTNSGAIASSSQNTQWRSGHVARNTFGQATDFYIGGPLKPRASLESEPSVSEESE